MHDLSFFLLKNWLPVGVSAIVFFSIGLLLARMTWGRYTQRLSYAVEENINLASQWSALGASQRDLFKKLRVRWQADRDSWETTLAERELRITALTRQLTSTGKAVPAELLVDEGLKEKIKELEAVLEREKTANRELREAADRGPVVSPVATAMAAAAPVESAEAVAATEFQARIRDLEQDLIDTHDELHDVRAQYQKQVALVESLEAKLIENPAAKVEEELALASDRITELEARLAGAEATTLTQAAEVAQWKALLPQRGREMHGLRNHFLSFKQSSADAVTGLMNEFTVREEAIALEKEVILASFAAKERQLVSEKEELKAEFATGTASLKAEFTAQEERRLTEHLAEKAALGESIATLTDDVAQRRAEIATLEADLLSKSGALDEATEKIAELEILQRRKASLQSELNDACHEMYDVRRALKARLADITTLENRLAELEAAEAKNGELGHQLDTTREELAAALQNVSDSGEQIKDLTEELTGVRHALSERTLESESLQSQLTDARHELSDVRIAYNARESDYQKVVAQMEELEAIIEDRSAEVNDLSTELRTQRDLVRQLKNTLAETEGELEALNDESRVLNAGVSAKTAFVEEQRVRIADLELALSQRYHELNAIRAEADESAKHSLYHEAQARQLEAELERRSDEFAASDKRIATAEEAVEAAIAKIASLSAQLEQSSASLAQLQDDLRQVSRDKDDTIRELDRATCRIAQLEEAAALRETQLAAISQELGERTRQTGDLDIRLNRLNTELESAREEQEISRLGITELEGALRASDERTLQLSTRLEEKETEVAALLAELETLRNSIEAHEAGESEAARHLEALQADYEATLGELEAKIVAAGEEQQEQEVLTKQQRDEAAQLTAELEGALRASDERTLQLSTRLEEKETEVAALLAELETLRNSIEAHEAGESEAARHLEALQADYEATLGELEAKIVAAGEEQQEQEVLTKQQRDETAQLTAELEALRTTIEERTAKLEAETEARTQSLVEVESLQRKLEQRSDSIRELQDQLSAIMLQRASRDNEIAVLKEKLLVVELELSEAREAEAAHSEALSALSAGNMAPPLTDPLVDEVSLAAAIHRSITAEVSGEEKGTSLDELAPKTTHHTPQKPFEPAPAPAAVESKGKKSTAGSDDDHTVYFNEGSATLSNAELEKIDLCARAIRRFGRKVEVTVIGYAGGEGNPDQNERLSARRADAVRERLLEKGVSQNLVTVRGAGQDRRFSDWKARRVEMIVVPVAVAEAVN